MNYSYLENRYLAARPVGRKIARVQTNLRHWWMGAIALSHVALALTITQSSIVVIAHNLVTLGVGLWLAAKKDRPLYQVGMVGGYIVGAEVLWRMGGGSLLWEFGKYAMCLIFVVALLVRRIVKWPPQPVLYFLFLLPSSLLTVLTFEISAAGNALSFNLSGPLSLCVCASFFSFVKLKMEHLYHIIFITCCPLISIAVVAATKIMSNPGVEITKGSNKDLSGGFGPNQVSAILGLGSFILLLYFFTHFQGHLFRFAILVIALAFGVQSALTFSRGGIYNAGGALLVAFFFLAMERRGRMRLMFGLILIALVAYIFIIPWLNTFTNGGISNRFEQTDLTGRGSIISHHLRVGLEHPLWGVGPGVSRTIEEPSDTEFSIAHTEFSRLFAEHGSFGVISFLLLLSAGVQTFLRKNSIQAKAIAASCMVWSLIYMTHAAMRLTAPSFMFGLAFATIIHERHHARLKGKSRARRLAGLEAG